MFEKGGIRVPFWLEGGWRPFFGSGSIAHVVLRAAVSVVVVVVAIKLKPPANDAGAA